MNLNIGCGNLKSSDELGIDINLHPQVDILADAHYLPFKSATINRITIHHVLEHLQNPTKIFKEFYRVLKSESTINGVVPHPLCSFYFNNPTHCSPWTAWGLQNFLERKDNEFGTNGLFIIKSIKISGRFARFFKTDIFEMFIIKYLPGIYEVRFVLEKSDLPHKG